MLGGKFNSLSMELDMEFEVKSGTVDFITVAYHNKPSNEQFNEWKTNGQINTPYETLETVKGKGETQSKITANLEYYIDDSSYTGDEVLLPTSISNIFFNNRKVPYFTTNNTSFSANNRWTMSGSSIVPLTYDGYGIKNRNAGTSNGIPKKVNGDIVVNSNGEPWNFDNDYIMDIQGKEIPEGIRTGKYDPNETTVPGQTVPTFKPNEKLDDELIKSIVTNPDDSEILNNDNQAFEKRNHVVEQMGKTTEYTDPTHSEETPSVNPGYGLINKIAVTLTNLGQRDRVFNYLIDVNRIMGTWTAVNKESGSIIANGEVNLDQKKVQRPRRAVNVTIPAGEKIEVRFEYSLICGGNPTMHHKLALDVPENSFISPFMEINTAPIYNKEIFDRDKAILYPQN